MTHPLAELLKSRIAAAHAVEADDAAHEMIADPLADERGEADEHAVIVRVTQEPRPRPHT